MAVNDENQHERTGDYRSRPRWSAGKKVDAVLRLLRGEPLETLSRPPSCERSPTLIDPKRSPPPAWGVPTADQLSRAP